MSFTDTPIAENNATLMDPTGVNTAVADPAAANNTAQGCALSECVRRSLNNYFDQLGTDQTPSELYDMVLAEVERPMLERVLQYTRNNQSKAAKVMGLSRGTLRKKLKIHGLD